MEGALEPPPLPPPTPSDRPEPEPRPRLMPPPPDDLHLLLPIDFLNSRYAPKICLYSGRGDQVAR
ncbi:MAG: hypothetical protein ACREJ2_00515, partial [Planctomycetota bacterium]